MTDGPGGGTHGDGGRLRNPDTGGGTAAGTPAPPPSGTRDPVEDGPKRQVRGELVKVLLHRRYDRGMSVAEFASRCVRRGEVHELVVTDRWEPRPGARVDRVAFLGFAELSRGGVVDRGDTVRIGGVHVGTVLGFDTCHFPNHYNILIHGERLLSGGDLELRPEMPVSFTQGAAPGAY